MTKKNPSNIAASVRQRLLNIIRETGDDANLVWLHYSIERFLYRLSISNHSADFILKGAMLFMVWTEQLYRPTSDLDLLSKGKDSGEYIKDVFCNLCNVNVLYPDGILFDENSVSVESIRRDQEYRGQRVSMLAYLGKIRIPIQIDIGFGDVVIPRARKVSYPTLLDFPAPHLRAYPREAVVAEKLQAMVMLGIVNSRMKDFYDLYVLARDFSFDGDTLSRAIKATFKRRRTEIPTETPMIFRKEFGSDSKVLSQWKAFINKSSLGEYGLAFNQVLFYLGKFLRFPIEAASGELSPSATWSPGGPWMPKKSKDGL